KRWTYRDRKQPRQHVSRRRRRQHLRWHDLDSLHAGEFTADTLAGGSSGIRRQRQSLGQRHERRSCANHDWRVDGNAYANTNSDGDTNYNAYSYSNPDNHAYSYSHAYVYSDSYCYPKSDTETTPASAGASDAAVRDQNYGSGRVLDSEGLDPLPPAYLKLDPSPTRALLPSQFYLLCRFSHKLHSASRLNPSKSLASLRLHSRAGYLTFVSDRAPGDIVITAYVNER